MDLRGPERSNREVVEAVSKETKPETEAGAPEKWSWVEATIWTERMLAALENGVQGGKWYSVMDKVYRPQTLERAFEQVKANRGAAGVDQVSVERFEAKREVYLQELHEQLKRGSYRPEAVRRVYIPKGGGKVRPLGIPTVKDRVVQTALKWMLEPIFEREFVEHSYGFRPGRGCKDARREVERLLKEGYCWVVDADLASYFDTIPKEGLRERVAERVVDGGVLRLIEAYLEQEIVEGCKRWSPQRGTPQGAVLSPLLANLYLHPLDREMEEGGYRMVRYADDFVVLCRGPEEAREALERVRRWCDAHGLTLHPEKTHVGNCREPGKGFEFLGYRFEGGRRYVRKKSLDALKDRIRERTKRTAGRSLRELVGALNPMLRGWFEYFKHAYVTTFKGVDGFIRRRLRAVLRKQEKRPGRGKTKRDHQRWPNAFFAAHGLFTLQEAHRQASRSR